MKACKIILDKLNVDKFKETGKIVFLKKSPAENIHVSIFHKR